MIPHAFLQDLTDRVDIVEVVGKYVQLKKAGANFSGLCPFHNEKSPSFTVSPTKQFFHCFGCGAHGTAIGFLMDHAGLPFPDAVEELARAAGMTVPQEPSRRVGYSGGGGGGSATGADGASEGDDLARGESSAQSLRRLADVMQSASDYYRSQLRQSPDAIAYLKGRGLTGEVALRFGLGYAPDGWQNLEKVYDDYQDDRLVETGLVIVSDKSNNPAGPGAGGASGATSSAAPSGPQGTAQGASQAVPQAHRPASKARRYDRFRERIMFPIRNVRGHVIGFGGRILHSGEPKYLNSPETPLFSKGNELYGLFEARLAIRERGFVLVVEGYMDVVALAQLGYPNAVATLGTACTPVHVQKLVRQTEKVVFSFDGDKAGRRAARRALEASLPHAADNREIAFLFLPTEHDPDSFIRENGEAAFAQAVARATPLSEFLLSEAVAGKDLDRPEGRAKALFDAKPMLQALPANALRVQIMHALAERLGVSVAEVAALCAVDQRMTPPRPKAAPVAARRRVKGSEERALRNLVMHPRLVLSLDAEALQVIAECAQQRMLFDEIIDHARQLGEQAAFRILYDVLRGSDNAPIYEEIFREILTYDENVRDLMSPHDENGDASDAHQAQRRQEFEELAFQEVLASLAKMRYDAVARRLDTLSGQPQLSPEERSEMMQLLGWMRDLKQSAAAKPEASR